MLLYQRAGRLANHREGVEISSKRRRTNSPRHLANTSGQSHGTPSGGGVDSGSGNGNGGVKTSTESCAATAVGVSGEIGDAPCDGVVKPLDRITGAGEHAIAEVAENKLEKLTRVGGEVGNGIPVSPVAAQEDTAADASTTGQKLSSSSTSRAQKLKRCMSADGDIDLAALRVTAVRAKWRRKHEQLLRKIES